MVSITISLSFSMAIILGSGGALWLYIDASDRGMDTADMWAVGFLVAFLLLPIIGGIFVLLYYSQKRPPRYPDPTTATQ